MYRGFNLSLQQESCDDLINNYLNEGRLHYNAVKKNIATTINGFKNDDGSIDATKMQSGWFPINDYNVFLSHSHLNEDLVIALAYWMKVNFGLSVFVDSCLWGNSKVLQHMLDEAYCKRPGKDNVFDYNLRNKTTEHVHMMLQTALASMIDNTECIIFLNTPDSILPNEVVSNTLSPWIYSELSTIQYVRKRDKEEHRQLLENYKSYSAGGELPTFKYNAPLELLTPLNSDTLNEWYDYYKNIKKMGAKINGLDALYHVTN